MNRTCINDTQSNSYAQNRLEEIIQYMYMIIYPIIFIVGLIGNLLSSLLFSTTELYQTSCAVYFFLLAIFDSLALIGGLHHCLVIGYHVEVPNATYCRARTFISYVSMDMASWMVVAISVDRFYKVKFPLQARIYCTRKLTIIISCVVAMVLILKNIHLSTKFIGDFSSDDADHCEPNPDYPRYVTFFRKTWPWIDLAMFVLLPFIIITSCNVFIIYNQYKRRIQFGHRNLDRSLIKFLLISSISFIICNFPIAITSVIYPYVSQNHGQKDYYDEVAFAFDLLRLPSYASLALNFYLYYYSSSLFRQQAILLFKRVFRVSIKPDQTHVQMNETARVRSSKQSNSNEESE